MSKVYTDNIEKRTGGTAMAVPATGKWPNANIATGIDAVKLADGTVTNAELQYINSLSSNAQTQITATVTVANDALPLAGGTMSGNVDFDDNVIQQVCLTDYAEKTQAVAAHDIDLALGNVQTYTLSGAQTLTFSNPPASPKSGSFTLLVTNGGSATLTWPTSVDWAGATAPTLTASGIDMMVFTTIDGGIIWYGFAAGLDMS